MKNARISEVGASAPTKGIARHGVLTPEASGAKAHIVPSVNVRAEARTSDCSEEFQIGTVPVGGPPSTAYGDRILVCCHYAMDGSLPITRIHDVAGKLELRVKEHFPQIARVTIHPEPVEER
jgi:Dimerisation domain of Zinc Transporter